MTPPNLRVYYIGNLDGTHAAVVAAVNQREACELLHSTVGHFKAYGGHRVELERMGDGDRLALSQPRTVFVRKILDYGGEWRKYR